MHKCRKTAQASVSTYLRHAARVRRKRCGSEYAQRTCHLKSAICVLELAKLETYKYYYEFVQSAFKKGSVALLIQDTDSFQIKMVGWLFRV